jgi:hypothetical protein
MGSRMRNEGALRREFLHSRHNYLEPASAYKDIYTCLSIIRLSEGYLRVFAMRQTFRYQISHITAIVSVATKGALSS